MDRHLIRPARHCRSVISQRELAKRRQASRAHPDLKLFPGRQIRKWKVLAVLWILGTPIERRNDRSILVLGELVQILVARPSDSFVCHLIRDVIRTRACGIQRDWRMDGIIEERIGNQTTRIKAFPSGWVNLEWIAITRRDCAVAPRLTHELILVVTLYIASVILVEICQAIVEQYRRSEIIGQSELQNTAIG